MIACGVKPGDEVIVPAYTFPAPAFSVLMANAIPIFADINIETYNIDENDVVSLLGVFKKVRAIIAVHLNGYPARVIKLREIADANNIKLIEDAAQAFGAKVNGRFVGTIGHVGCFSFMPAKQLASCGELGGICTNDLELINNANSVKTYGRKVLENSNKFFYNIFSYGFNYKPSPFNCLFLKPQLEHFEKIISSIQKNVRDLNAFIDLNVPYLETQNQEPGFEHVYHFCRYKCNGKNLELSNTGLLRECIMDIMQAEGLPLRLYQTHPVYGQLIFRRIKECKKNDVYPWALNVKNLQLYRENYSYERHKNTLNAIDYSFAIGNNGPSASIFLNKKLIDLYKEGFFKITSNINELVEYYYKKTKYESPYDGNVRLSDTNGDFV